MSHSLRSLTADMQCRLYFIALHFARLRHTENSNYGKKFILDNKDNIQHPATLFCFIQIISIVQLLFLSVKSSL